MIKVRNFNVFTIFIMCAFLAAPAFAEPIKHKQGKGGGKVSRASQSLSSEARLVLKDSRQELNNVAPGTTVIQDFVIRNGGRSELVISRVVATCGCTVAEFDRSIAAGASGKVTLKVALDPNWAGRRIEQSAVIESNDSKNPFTAINLVILTSPAPGAENAAPVEAAEQIGGSMPGGSEVKEVKPGKADKKEKAEAAAKDEASASAPADGQEEPVKEKKAGRGGKKAAEETRAVSEEPVSAQADGQEEPVKEKKAGRGGKKAAEETRAVSEEPVSAQTDGQEEPVKEKKPGRGTKKTAEEVQVEKEDEAVEQKTEAAKPQASENRSKSEVQAAPVTPPGTGDSSAEEKKDSDTAGSEMKGAEAEQKSAAPEAEPEPAAPEPDNTENNPIPSLGVMTI